jgi:hypothetical protein
MPEPEHVYASILLLKSVPVEKSGVLVTANVNDGDPNFLTIAVNEGAGGAVNNQLAEGILLDRISGVVRLTSEASQGYKNVMDPLGGLREVTTSGSERILSAQELVRLDTLVDEVKKEYPAMKNPKGRALPADIEFGFLKGQLVLFQIRPFLQSESTTKNGYLVEMDQPHIDGEDKEEKNKILPADRIISLDRVPLRK